MSSPRTREVILFGGPLNGRHVHLSPHAESYDVGPIGCPLFRYTYAGKFDQRVMFAISPRSRRERRAVKLLIGIHGRDPRIEAEFAKEKPITGGTRLKHGRGRLRRQEARLVQS